MATRITFHPTCIPSGNGFRPVVRLCRQIDGGKSRMTGNKASNITFPTREAAVAMARQSACTVALGLMADFPADTFAVSPPVLKSECVKTVSAAMRILAADHAAATLATIDSLAGLE